MDIAVLECGSWWLDFKQHSCS